ncbi:hypothetical protein DVH24_010890 [Malus domestica]|uniref:Uncharacterized protein n=1 Tax=Malus domestica TaxID=3750 RepID=A0A498JTR7_MALDO|nr:hypothetical protein DVH24_010890 [Malus domestica]
MTVGELPFSGEATTNFIPLVTTDSHYFLLSGNQNRRETFSCTRCLICLRLDAISTRDKFPRFPVRPASFRLILGYHWPPNGREESAWDGAWSCVWYCWGWHVVHRRLHRRMNG